MQVTFTASSARELHDQVLSFCKEFGINNGTSVQANLPFSGGTIQAAATAQAPAIAAAPAAAATAKNKGGRPKKEVAATSFTDEEETAPPAAAQAAAVAAGAVPAGANPTPAVDPAIPMNAPIAGLNHAVTKQQVTDALTAVNGKKGLAACRALLLEFGTDRLSSVPAERYPDFIAKCNVAMA